MNAPAHGKFGIGASPRRKEDVALLTGRGNFTDDNVDPNLLHAYVLRSPHAHAKFKITDISAAKAAKGIHAVMVAADVAHLKPLTCQALLPQIDESMVEPRDIPLLCEDTVRHVGDAIAFIVADSLILARDAAELIEVDYDMKDAIADTASALDAGVPQVYDDRDGNLAFTVGSGDPDKTKAIFDGAAHISELTVINNRLVANYIETRSCVADWNIEEDRFNLNVCSQGVHGIQGVLTGTFGLPAEKIHVTTGDVGGGFGTKAFTYREYPLAMAAAKLTGRQVKWTADRTEHFIVDAHGRDNVVTARMAMDKDGTFLALDIDLIAAMGAYLHCYGPFIPFLGGTMATGLYDIDTYNFHLRGVYTNTVPVDAYRGAGRPEAAYLIERLVDQCAFDMKMTKDDIRRLNFIKPEQLPYTTQGGRMYDTGEFVEHMEECMERSNWSGIEARNEEAKKQDKFRGIGMATYIEACAFAGSEPAFLELGTDGVVTLKIGTQTNGQGHATAYAQLAADNLGLDIDQIDVRQGDTDELSSGGGTGGSRSVPLGGVSVVRGSQALAEKLKELAADKLEAAAGDIELTNGEARVVGTDSVISLADLAQSASNPDDLKGEGNFVQDEATYPNGTHICEVEIEPATGVTKIIAYTIVDDFGVTVNPMLLAGQVHGGVAQGIGQCLNEHTIYDEDGQLLTASFMDYAVPRADDIPNFNFNTRNVPSTTNALGIKGAGEAGTIGACPAVMNAVCDALHRHNGTEHIDMPVTPSVMWNALNNA